MQAELDSQALLAVTQQGLLFGERASIRRCHASPPICYRARQTHLVARAYSGCRWRGDVAV